jgi:hypothetical protein
MTSVLREPLLHFLILGTLAFMVYVWVDDTPPPVADDALVVTPADAQRLAEQFEATWRRPPQPQELDGLIDEYIREEVYVREARALALDRGDAVVRRRLQQKMEFLTESGAESVEASDALLQRHLSENKERFLQSALVEFDQVPLDAASQREDVGAVLAALRDGASPEALGGPTLLPAHLPPSPRQVVDGTFGDGFFQRAAALEPSVWSGPVLSAYGPHLVRLREFTPSRLPPLEEIRDEVERDWRASVAQDLRSERYDALRSRYQISRPDAAEVLGQ